MEPGHRQRADEPEEDDPLATVKALDNFFDTGDGGAVIWQELEKRGWTVPTDLDKMTDEDVAKHLTELVWSLWDLGVELDGSDHLSDRELYADLIHWSQNEVTFIAPENPNYTLHHSPGGDDNNWEVDEVWMRYYADDKDREQRLAEYPDEELPPKELPRHYRSWLPWRDQVGRD